jgi:pilus assembly protein CpaC
VPRVREVATILLMAGCSSILYYKPVRADDIQPAAPPQSSQPAQQAPAAPQRQAAPAANGTMGKLVVTVGKSLIIDSPLDIRRLSVANGDLAEAVAVNPKEVLINGKAPGETSLIVWQQNGARLVYDLTVRMSSLRLDAVRQQIARDFPDADVNVTFENDTAFVRGKVKDVTSADRIMAIAATLGKVVNLLHVEVPPVDPQVVLKVRFANVDRSSAMDLGVNFASGAFNQSTAIGTGGLLSTNGAASFSPSSVVNILLARRDINLVAAIQALQSRHVLEMLAEPDLLAISGQQASFLAGGEFPFPMVQPGIGGTSVSIMWREYGIRLNFLPNITPRGTIRLKVAPEVSSLDFTNAVTVGGVTVPALSERRVQTEVELESGQSFIIAGLLDNQANESFAKIPGIGNIPILGKLFQTKSVSRNNSELLVLITPEVVRPIPAGQKPPELNMPLPFMTNNSNMPLQQPGMDKTGPVPVHPTADSVPVEQLSQKDRQPAGAPAVPMFQMIPMMPVQNASPNQGLTPTPIANPGTSK